MNEIKRQLKMKIGDTTYQQRNVVDKIQQQSIASAKKKKPFVPVLLSIVVLATTLFFVFSMAKEKEMEIHTHTTTNEQIVEMVTVHEIQATDQGQIVQSEVPYESVSDELYLDKEIQTKNLNNLERIGNISIIKNGDNLEVKADYYNKATGEKILTSQSTNELSNAKEYQSIILNEWYVNDDTSTVEATKIQEHLAVIRHSTVGANAIYVITDTFVYMFANAEYSTLLNMAEQIEYK